MNDERLPQALLSILPRVDKPGRYVGGEMNAARKDPASVRATIALAFPDVYDLGMSYHGFRILYERINADPDFLAERVFTPWPDFADALREADLPLYMLETYRPLKQADLVGFTLQHELNYTNVLETLDLAGIPLRAEARADADPIVIAGGEGAYSPEPMAPFIDAFAVGDGEELALDILRAVADARQRGDTREAILEALAAIPGVYVPAFYDVQYTPDAAIRAMRPNRPVAPERIVPRVFNLPDDLGPTHPVVPVIRTVQDRTVIEVRRGCVNGCRFCQAGMIARPIRERPVEQVVDIARQTLAETGDGAISLLSLSTADYSEILPLARRLNAEFADRRISVSLPSLRIKAFDVELATEVSSVRKSGFTFAPEAGSEALRRRINKPLDETEFFDIVEQVARAGWKTIKMYFMLGLPGETDEDLDGIARIVQGAIARVADAGLGRLAVNVTLSPFVPKPHTPFQWEPQASPDEIKRRMNYVRDVLPRKGVSVKTSPIATARLEGVLARGDRRLADAIEHAWREGSRFDGWSETFDRRRWEAAFEACGIDPEWVAQRERPDDEILPWDHIASGPGKAFLARQRDLARAAEITPDCQDGPCAGCDACGMPKEHRLARDAAPADANSAAEQSGEKQSEQEQSGDMTRLGGFNRDRVSPIASHCEPSGRHHPSDPPPPAQRLRLRFTKTGPLRFVSHLDLAEAVHRQVRRTGAPVAHSHGFNPQPRISLSPPLPLGFQAEGELADVLMLQRIDPAAWLRELRALSAPQGLEWIGIEEMPLDAPSIQQAVERYDYLLLWHAPAPDADALRRAVDTFLAADEWPVQIQRKKKTQTRDARAFALSVALAPPLSDHAAAVEMALRSDNGTTLSPLIILAAITKDLPTPRDPDLVIRRPVEVPMA